MTGPQDERITFVPGTTGTYYLLVYNYYNTTPPLIKPYGLKITS